MVSGAKNMKHNLFDVLLESVHIWSLKKIVFLIDKI